MKAVILVAGRGTRMADITKDNPKCLLEIAGGTIIERQIELLLEHSIEEIYVVIGYKANKIRNRIQNIENVGLIVNKEYSTTDNMYSLYLTHDNVKGSEFILLNGDVVFEKTVISKLVAQKEKNIAPVDSAYYDLEELKIKEKEGLVVGILPKKAPEQISDGSTIGIFKFSSEGSLILFDEIEKLVAKDIKNKWFEYALNNIVTKMDMYTMDIHGSKWIEVDTAEDIKRAQELFGE